MNKNKFHLITLCLFLPLFLCRCTQRPQHAGDIQSSIQHYQQLSAIHWYPISIKTPLTYGDENAQIPIIKQRLNVLGDLNHSNLNSTKFDSALTNAIKQFQWRHGLNKTGTLDQKTLNALNINPTKRLQQLHRSLQKWQQIPKEVGARYIHINIPSYELRLVDNGQKILNMKVVVGKQTRPTPEVYSKVKTIVLNPTWNVPQKLAAEDIVPKQLNDPAYLKKHKIKIYKDWNRDGGPIDPSTLDWSEIWEQGFPYHFTQSPGNGNSLGKIKFLFDNRHSIYMHDTPKKYLFKKIKRAYSSGCIRLEKPFQLAEYFLQDNPKYDQHNVDQILQENKTKYISIKNPIPLHITYITAWVDDKGYVHFREDIYNRN